MQDNLAGLHVLAWWMHPALKQLTELSLPPADFYSKDGQPSKATHSEPEQDSVWCRYFPTILIVLLAVFNDGAMIALSKDRVVASPVPNHWDLKSIFIVGERARLCLLRWSMPAEGLWHHCSVSEVPWPPHQHVLRI